MDKKLTVEEIATARHAIIKAVTAKHNVTEAEAADMYDQSYLPELIVNEPKCDRMAEYWANKLIDLQAYRHAVEYVNDYMVDRERLIEAHITEHGLSRNQAERCFKHADEIYNDFKDIVRKYESEHNEKC